MLDSGITLLQDFNSAVGRDSAIEFVAIPVHQFKWMIYLSILAFHGVVAVILTELMGRTYGKPWLWFILAFGLPVVGWGTIGLYHLIMATTVTDARQQTFWERVLEGGPVSLLKILRREQAQAQEVKLVSYNVNPECGAMNGNDPELNKLLEDGKYNEARAIAWNMMEISRDANDQVNVDKYQYYLEIIAQSESMNSGVDLGSSG